jgi:Tol biopolymer transport system component
MRPLTYERKGLADPAFSPQGDRVAFVADNGSGDDAKSQIFVLRLDGGDARPVSSAPEGIEQFSWRPDGTAIAYVAEDAKPKLEAPKKYRDSFVVGNNPITAHAAPPVLHVWLLALDGGKARQLTRRRIRRSTTRHKRASRYSTSRPARHTNSPHTPGTRAIRRFLPTANTSRICTPPQTTRSRSCTRT